MIWATTTLAAAATEAQTSVTLVPYHLPAVATFPVLLVVQLQLEFEIDGYNMFDQHILDVP